MIFGVRPCVRRTRKSLATQRLFVNHIKQQILIFPQKFCLLIFFDREIGFFYEKINGYNLDSQTKFSVF